MALFAITRGARGNGDRILKRVFKVTKFWVVNISLSVETILAVSTTNLYAVAFKRVSHNLSSRYSCRGKGSRSPYTTVTKT